MGCSLNSLPNLRSSSSSWDLCWTKGALLLFASDKLSVRSFAAVLRISFTSTGKSGVGPEGLVVVVAVATVEEKEEEESKKVGPTRGRSWEEASGFGARETAGEDWEFGVRRFLVL